MLLDYVTEKTRDTAGAARERIDELSRIGNLTPVESAEMEVLKVRLEREMKPTAHIDLYSILAMRRQDGKPRWAVVNPYKKITPTNGGAWRTSYFSGKRTLFTVRSGFVQRPYRDEDSMVHVNLREKSQGFSRPMVPDYSVGDVLVPAMGFPTIPPKVRLLMQQHQECDGLAILYQPESWNSEVIKRPDPDPALLIRHTSSSPFEVLAVWGHDGPLIKEFSV